MDIEDLTKSQIVLLTLLVSFMTSIATGIVTVALMQQAPPMVVQSVNRIIRQTVGQVASSTRVAQAAAVQTVTEVKTVVVRDSDTISKAVAGASHSVVRLYSHDATDPKFLGLGVIINSSGLVITDESALGEDSDANIKRADGSITRAFVTDRDKTHGIAYLTQATSSTVASLGDPATLSTTAVKLGDMIVALGGSTVDRIRAGYATTLLSVEDTGTVPVIETDIPHQGILPGTPLIDATGNLIGLSTGVSRAAGGGSFVPVSAFYSPLSQGTIKATSGLAK